MLAPVGREALLVSAAESPFCFLDWPARYVFDVERDFGMPWYTMSAPVAVLVARLMGCTSLVMLGHDAYAAGDTRRVAAGELVDDASNAGYRWAGQEAARLAAESAIEIRWGTA